MTPAFITNSITLVEIYPDLVSDLNALSQRRIVSAQASRLGAAYRWPQNLGRAGKG
jgi:hypothetical protein